MQVRVSRNRCLMEFGAQEFMREKESSRIGQRKKSDPDLTKLWLPWCVWEHLLLWECPVLGWNVHMLSHETQAAREGQEESDPRQSSTQQLRQAPGSCTSRLCIPHSWAECPSLKEHWVCLALPGLHSSFLSFLIFSSTFFPGNSGISTFLIVSLHPRPLPGCWILYPRRALPSQ